MHPTGPHRAKFRTKNHRRLKPPDPGNTELKPPHAPPQRLFFYLDSQHVLKFGSMAQQHTHQPQQALMDQYNEFRQQVHIKPPTSHESQLPHEFGGEDDLDMDAQLENVSPERGGSSLQVSLGANSIQVAQATPSKTVPIGDGTPPTLPYRNSRLEDASESQTTKRRKAADYSVTSTPHSKISPYHPLTYETQETNHFEH